MERLGSWVRNEHSQPTNLEGFHVASFAGFAGFYALLRWGVAEPLSRCSTTYEGLGAFEKAQWTSRIVSQLHVILALGLASYAISLVPCWWCVESIVYLRSRPIEVALANTGGYLFYDLVDMVRTRVVVPGGKMDGGPLVLMHHVFGFVGYFLSWSYARCGFIYAVSIGAGQG